jgi:aminoglycoside phosphotransferase (APT) family kinase protein
MVPEIIEFGERDGNRDSWAEFVVARAVQCLDELRHLLVGVLERPERGISALESGLASRDAARPSLVRGDYFPENVMVADDGRICGRWSP